jgi:LPXTG-motif cell wall-anchored protein
LIIRRLAGTGSDSGPLVVGGAIAVLAGAALVVLAARRRRPTPES